MAFSVQPIAESLRSHVARKNFRSGRSLGGITEPAGVRSSNRAKSAGSKPQGGPNSSMGQFAAALCILLRHECHSRRPLELSQLSSSGAEHLAARVVRCGARRRRRPRRLSCRDCRRKQRVLGAESGGEDRAEGYFFFFVGHQKWLETRPNYVDVVVEANK